jgi:hypothetical protein
LTALTGIKEPLFSDGYLSGGGNHGTQFVEIKGEKLQLLLITIGKHWFMI